MPRPAAKKTARKTTRAAKRATASEAVAREPRRVTKAQLIDELNKDLAKEFSALIQYVQHASALTGPQYGAIQAELVVHSNEEHMHAISLSDQIDFLGGVPGRGRGRHPHLAGLEDDA